MSSRSRRAGRRRQRATTTNISTTPSGQNACIDLTVDIGGDEVIDLTHYNYHSNIMDSPVVILSPTDDVGPVRRRGSGRRGLRRSHSNRRRHREAPGMSSPSTNMPSSSRADLLNLDHSEDDDLPDIPFDIPAPSSQANASFLQSPAAVKITCPVCLDDVKQIKASNRRIMSTICGHIFCEECITSAIRSLRSCPSCRKSLSTTKIHPIFL